MAERSDTSIAFVENLKKQWMDTVDALKDPLMIIGADQSIIKGNKALARLAGKDIKEIVGRKLSDVFDEQFSPCHASLIADAVKAEAETQFELTDTVNQRFYEVSCQPQQGENGATLLVVWQDRTEAKKLAEKLLQSQKMASIGVFAGGIAHEINNPLGGILIFSQMLLREMDSTSPHYQDVVEIESATQRCKEIVENLLEFARRQPLKAKKTDLKEVLLADTIETALQFSKVNLAKYANINIVKAFSEEKLATLAVRNKLVQIILNLVLNACQAMPSGGTLTLATYSRSHDDGSEWAVIEVADTGIGMAEADISSIFDPFYTQKAPGEGTGLGLSICHGIAEEFGAKFEVESTLNEGSTFRLVCPRHNGVMRLSA